MRDDNSDAAISFVEKLLVLLDEGAFTATYKYAVLLALIDLCMERSEPDGGPPARLATAAIAEKVVTLYWPHSSLFRGTGGAAVLRQNSGGQALGLRRWRPQLRGPASTRCRRHLVRLNGLLRPLIKRQWADLVNRFNRGAVEESTLEEFLFGTPRRPTGGLVDGLRELQTNRCFYCQGALRDAVDIDHFIPWARHPDDAIHNLVLAHRLCNNAKRDFLAAAPHVTRWSRHLDGTPGRQLHQLATEQRWASHLDTSRSVARAIYLRLPDDAKLWMRKNEFATFDRPSIETALVPVARFDVAAEDVPPFDPDDPRR